MARDIMISLLNQWSKANVQFMPPIIISEKAICDKIVRAWTTASKIALKKITKKVDVERFSRRLDKLFDLCRCQCPILTCTDIKCEGCSTNIHIQCQCPRDQKIPTIELGFIKAQREKVGEISSMQIAGDDIVE